MARTRTSADPHDSTAATGLTHAKPPLYAPRTSRGGRSGRCLAVMLWTIAGLPPAVGAQTRAQDRLAPPCAACAVVSLTPPQAIAAPARMNGVRLLLRVAAGSAADEWSVAFAALRGRGARIGLHLVGVPADTDPALRAGGDALVVEVPAGAPADLSYALKRAFVAARGASEQTRLVLAADTAVLAALLREDLGAYVDAVLPIGGGDIGGDARLTRWVMGPLGPAAAMRMSAGVVAARRPENG